MYPKARQEKLTVRQLPDETLVYDLQRHKAHCLNPTAALVWRHCDGQTSLADLARLIEEQLQTKNAPAVVRLALEQLSRRHLLEEPVKPLRGAARVSRREVLKKLAVAAVVLPLVMTVSGQVPIVNASPRTVRSFLGKPCQLILITADNNNNGQLLDAKPGQCGPYKCLPDRNALNNMTFNGQPTTAPGTVTGICG